MKAEQFNKIVMERINKITTILETKGSEYTTKEDRLHNFKIAGVIQNIIPEKALIGMFTKHLVSILDMVEDLLRGKQYSLPKWDEKIGDAINYLILLEGLIIERRTEGEK